MDQPKNLPGARLCIAVKRNGVTAYGNPDALRSIAKWLEWIAQADPSEHFECHVGAFLEDDQSRFEGKSPRNVWVLLDKEMSSAFDRRGPTIVDGEEVEALGFELTFMAMPEQQLDGLATHQSSGLLPPDPQETPENIQDQKTPKDK